MKTNCKYGQTTSGRPYLPHPTYEEYRQGLRNWVRQFPDRIKVSVRGRTLRGNEILLVEVTDFAVPPNNKQVFLYTGAHVGLEINSMTTALRFIKWLLGESELACETRRKQVVLLVPIAEPDAFIEQRRNDPATGEGAAYAGYYSWTGILKPEKNPEAVALAGILEEYLPDVHIDAHGFAQADTTMCESTGVSGGSALVSRTFAPQIIDAMVTAADRAGFGVRATNGEWGGGFMECTGEMLVQYRAQDIGPEYNDHFAHRLGSAHFVFRESNISLPVYAYHRCHSLATTMEIGIEQSALVQLQKLMEIGNHPWIAERDSGYPVNFMGYGQNVALAGYGRTAMERRRSRVELWRHFDQFSLGQGNPPHHGDLTVLVATNARGARLLSPTADAGRQIGESGKNSSLHNTVIFDSFDHLFARLRNDLRLDVAAMIDFQSRTPVDRYGVMSAPFGISEAGAPLTQGLGLRLFIPFADVTIREVLLNGQSLVESDSFGYRQWGGSGTIVQVNLPPDRIADLQVVQCGYDMKIHYPCGFNNEDWRLEGA